MHDPELDYIGPMYRTLGSVPDERTAKESLFRMLFQRYEVTPEEIKAVQVELSADKLDGRRCERTIPGIIEAGRGNDYLIPRGASPPLIVNWLCCFIRPGEFNLARRSLSLWLQEAYQEAVRRTGMTRHE